MNRFYLDTNILVCLVSKDPRKKSIVKALDCILNIEDAVLVTSAFAFVEMAKVIINSGAKIPSATNRLIMRITKASKIEGFSFEILPTSPEKSYTFDQFWIDVGINMNLYNPGWGDSIHCVVMKNNSVENIVSMDAKDDFETVPGIILFHPEAILEAMT